MKYILILILSVFILSCKSDWKLYTVEVEFCDTRSPDTIQFESYFTPSMSDIMTYKEAVPRYRNYLNVCNINVLKEEKK